MAERLGFSDLSSITPSDTRREAYYYSKNRKLPPFSGIVALCHNAAAQADFNTDLAYGVGNHLLATFNTAPISREEAALVAIHGLANLASIVPDKTHKARSFNYLPTDKTVHPIDHMAEAADNAQYWLNTLGPQFFTESEEAKDNYFRGSIGDGFSITAKGGSGAGTFSLDLAIESDRADDIRDKLFPSHELWRVGIDTATVKTDEGAKRIGRIIRTGSGVKPGDKQKESEFRHFRSQFGTLPQRALTYIAAQLMYDQDFHHGLALSTAGALELSSLKKSRGLRTTYSDLHRTMGFQAHHNQHWLAVHNIQNRFYQSFVMPHRAMPRNRETGLLPHEPAQLDKVIAGFNSMVSYPSNSEFPIKLCQDDSPTETAKAMHAFLVLQGRYPN